MSSERSTTTHHTPSRLLIIWLAGFSIIGLIAALMFFSLVRDLVRGWNTTALAAPTANGVTVTNPQTGQPIVAEVPTWTGVERVTVLLLGIDERKQETGPFRTDTMLVLTIDPIAKTAGILSIPRDLWVQIPAMETDGKINTAHFLGDAYNYPGGGPALAVETVKQELGLPVDYYVRFNFDSFEKIVDAIGGVEICVAETIDDPLYPALDNYGYDPLHIDAGCQTMNGALALKYARTRHGGTDFDRAKRQQQVILAIRDKVIKQDLLPQLVTQAPALLDTLQYAIKTNLSLEQMIQLAQTGNADRSEEHQAGDHRREHGGGLQHADRSAAECAGADSREDPRTAREILLLACRRPTRAARPADPAATAARIVVENGTQINGLAARTGDRLKAAGYNVVEVTSADRFDYAQSQIIRLSRRHHRGGGDRPDPGPARVGHRHQHDQDRHRFESGSG